MLSKYQLSRIETLGIIRPMLCLLSSLKNEVKPRKKKKKKEGKESLCNFRIFSVYLLKCTHFLQLCARSDSWNRNRCSFCFESSCGGSGRSQVKKICLAFTTKPELLYHGSNVHEDNFSYVLLWFSLIFFFSERMEGDENFKSLQYTDKEWLIPHIFDLFAGNDIGKSRFYLSL